ncbi:MAG TPA: hypothetical protein VJS37_01005 [Terriglobales bacterium]|nr:hypothetical protein [Terriglobales bacterium]
MLPIVIAFTLIIPSFSGAQTPETGRIPSSQPSVTPRSSTLELRVGPGKVRIVKSAAPAVPVTTHERFATFLAGSDFSSELLLQNLRLDAPVTVTPILIVSRGEAPLEPITLPAHSAAKVDINAALLAHGLNDKSGVVVARYDFDSYGAVSAVVTSEDETHHLYLSSVGQSPEEFWYGTALDAVVWAPEEGAEGFISVMNTTSGPKKVQMTVLLNGRAAETREIEIGSRQNRLLPIDSVLKQSLASGAGIRVAFTGKPGEILTEGTLFKKQTGFSKHIRFLDTFLHFSDHSLRTHFVLVGRQPLGDGFPAQVSFRSVAAVRNIDSAPVQITPVVKSLQGGSVRKISLKPIILAGNESRTIDFNAEQRAGNLPMDFTQGSLELIPDSDHNSIVAELFNFNEHSRNYVVGSSFSAFPARATGSVWRTDGTFQTTIVIDNTAKEADDVTLKLFSENGTYEKVYSLAGGAMTKINFKELQQNQVRDKNGHLLTATSGTLSLSGGRGVHSKLSFEKLIHSADESEYVGLLANPCNYVTGISGFLEGDQSPYAAWIDAFWTDGSITEDPAAGTGTSNSSLVQISNDGSGDIVTVDASPDGASHNVTLSFQQSDTACDICSGDEFFASQSVSTPVPDHLKILSDTITSLSSCSSTKQRIIKYQEVDSTNNVVQGLNIKETFGGFSTNTCNNGTPSTSSTCAPDDAGGQFTDGLTINCNSVGGSCGLTATSQKWVWCKAAGGTQTLGTIGDIILHNDSISVNGSTSTRSAGTCVYSDGTYANPCR